MYYIVVILFVLLLFIFSAAATSVITIPLYYLIRRSKRRSLNPYWKSKFVDKSLKRILIILTCAVATYSTYRAFFPSDSFYIDEFEHYTKLSFPCSGEIISKGASYPDIHGDYSAAAVIKLSNNDFYDLRNKIRLSKQLQRDTIYPFKFGNQIKDIIYTLDEKSFTENFSINPMVGSMSVFSIGFDETNKLIAFDRNTW